MAISAPKSARSIGYVSSQFKDLLAIHQANMEKEIRESKEKSEEFWAKLNLGIGLTKELKNYRDAFLADKRTERIQIGTETVPLYQIGKQEGKNIFKKAKDFIYAPDLEVSDKLKQVIKDIKKPIETEDGTKIPGISKDRLTQIVDELSGKGMSQSQINDVLGINEKLGEITSIVESNKKQKELDNKRLANIELQEKNEVSYRDAEQELLDYGKELDEDAEWMKKAQAGKAKRDAYKQKVMKEGDAARKELDKIELRQFERKPISMEKVDTKSLAKTTAGVRLPGGIPKMSDKQQGRMLQNIFQKEVDRDLERYESLKNVNVPFADEGVAMIKRDLDESQKGLDFAKSLRKGKGIAFKDKAKEDRFKQFVDRKTAQRRKKISKDAAMMQLKSMDDVIGVYQDGGMLKGPSHKNGGILTQVGNQPIEMEGGEYVIRKSSAKKLGKKTLDYINKTGKLPKKMQEGGYIDDINNPNVLSDALNIYGNVSSMRNAEGGLSSLAPAFAVGETGARYVGMGAQKLGLEKTSKTLGKTSQGLGGASSVLGGLQAFDSQDETGISQAQGALSVAKGASDIAGATLGKKVGEKALEKAAPVLSIASGARDILSADSTGMDKASGAASVVSGIAGAGSAGLIGTTTAAAGTTAATNFWNPVGWVAGAAAIGLTAASLMGVGKKPQNIRVRAPKVNI